MLAERVLDSTADTLVTAVLDSRRRKCHTGSPEDMGKRNRGERGRESKKKGKSSSSEQTVESCSSDEGFGRDDESRVRRTAATKPGALLHSGLVMMQRHLGRQVEDCEAVDAVQAKGLAAAYLATALKPNAGSRLSFGALRKLQSSAEAVDLLMRGRVVSAGDVSDPEIPRGWSVARHLEVFPEAAVSTMSSGLRGVVVKAETRTEQSRAAVVLRYREYLGSPSGRWVRYRLHELVGKKCFCHCSLDEVCHVDEFLKVMDDEQRAGTWDDRPPDLGGMSPAEVGLALKLNLLAPRSESAASVERKLRFAAQRPRAGGDIERHSPLSAHVLSHSG